MFGPEQETQKLVSAGEDMSPCRPDPEKMLQNPLDKPDTFYLSLGNPNPTSSKTKDGPVYRVSFEMLQEEWQNFMDAQTKGMVIECACQVTHRNGESIERDPNTVDMLDEKTDAEKKKELNGGPLSVRSDRLARDNSFYQYIVKIEPTWKPAHKVDSSHDFCRAYIRDVCSVKSRKEFDHDKQAAEKFRKLISRYVYWATENGYDIA